MDPLAGHMGVVSCQSRRGRRAASGPSAWTVLAVACILFGGAATAAQAAGQFQRRISAGIPKKNTLAERSQAGGILSAGRNISVNAIVFSEKRPTLTV